MRRAIGALVVLCSACNAGNTLAVELRTDLVPGIEFVAVETRVEGEPAGIVLEVTHGDDYLDGARIAEFSDLVSGTHEVTVTLLDETRQPVAERVVLVTISTTMTITVLVSRDCAGLSCPANETCFGGRCVDQACLYGSESGCPDPECSADTDCAPAASCATARCAFGVCQIRADDTMCGASQYCHPDCGCVLRPPDPDAGAFDPATYCGACGVDCTSVPGVVLASCGAGACVIERCAEGVGDCDGDPSNGCESTVLPWRQRQGGDHCRSDWTLGDTTIGSDHYNVGQVVIPMDARVQVESLASGGGELEIHAHSIVIEGLLNGNGAGHPGGAGGRGESSGNPYCGGDGDAGRVGGGPAGGGGGRAGIGNNGTSIDDPGCRGANGGGASGGGQGGYGPFSMDTDDVHMGSGGGGGGGGGSGSRYGTNNNYPAGAGGGGGAGGSGGGVIRLFATDDVVVHGEIRARGAGNGGNGGNATATCSARGDDPAGGAGGNPSGAGTMNGGAGSCMGLCGGGATNTCGGDGGRGAVGSGGGVLIVARSIDAAGGTIDVRDGNVSNTNAGAIKLRFACTHIEGDYRGAFVDPRTSGVCE